MKNIQINKLSLIGGLFYPMKKFKKLGVQFIRFNSNNQLQIDSFNEKIYSSRKKVRTVFDKIKELKKLDNDTYKIFDDLYEDARESVQELFDEYKIIKTSLPEDQTERYKEELKELQKKMDILWNTIYMSPFDKFETKKSFWGH